MDSDDFLRVCLSVDLEAFRDLCLVCRGFVGQEVGQSSQWRFHLPQLILSVIFNSSHVRTPVLLSIFRIEGFGLNSTDACYLMIFGFLKEAVVLDPNLLHLPERDLDFLLQLQMESLRDFQDKLPMSLICFGVGLGSVIEVLILDHFQVRL